MKKMMFCVHGPCKMKPFTALINLRVEYIRGYSDRLQSFQQILDYGGCD